MGMRNSEYWQERFVQLENALYSKREEAAAEIEAAYRQAQRDIEAAIDKWYGRIAVNNGISKAEAMKLLSANQLKEFHWDVWEYIRRGEENAVNQKWMKELENASAKFHISRLEALKLETENSLQFLFAKQREISERTITEGYEEGYYHTAFELQKGFNIGFDVAKIDRNYLEKVIAKPWAADGRNFSERIWGNRVKLVNELHSDIIRSLSAGTGTQRVIDNIAKKMNVQKNHAQALVLTEGAFFSTAAEKDCYGDFDVENYEILATLDDRTSDICQTMDGKVFPVKDMQPGVTAPPFHVRCRSTTVPFFDDDFGLKGSRAAKDENGQTYYVPDDMKYPEWKKTFVEGGSKEGLEKTTQKGGSTVYKRVDKTGGSGIIKVDEVIGRSVGASAKNYPVRLPDGNHAKFAEGSTISKIKVFAGNGTDVPIRDAVYLENEYKIPADKWQKVRGEGTVVFEGKNRVAEIHWYEADGEKVNMKVKRWLDES